MINFEEELEKLLAQESKPLPQSEFVELAAVGQQLLLAFSKKQSDISVQIEELYDLTKESDNTVLLNALHDEKLRTRSVVGAIIGLCDLIDDFYEFSSQSGSEDISRQALLMRKKTDGLLGGCGIARFGEKGQPLNPRIHTVQAGTASHIPKEHVAKVLQSGYVHMGMVLRKATIIVSLGMEESQ